MCHLANPSKQVKQSTKDSAARPATSHVDNLYSETCRNAQYRSWKASINRCDKKHPSPNPRPSVISENYAYENVLLACPRLFQPPRHRRAAPPVRRMVPTRTFSLRCYITPGRDGIATRATRSPIHIVHRTEPGDITRTSVFFPQTFPTVP